MASSPKTKSTNSGAKSWFKNAASAFKYTAVELGSDHMPFVTGTVTKSVNAFNDLKNWVKNSTPFRATPGGNAQEKKFYKVASNLVKAGFNDIKTGRLAFDGLNTEIGKLLENATEGDEFDDWGEGENSFDYDAALNNDTYLSGIEISSKATVGAISQSTDIIAQTTARGFDVLAKRNQINNIIMTSKLTEQLITGNKITSAINSNLMSIVEQNNEASAFRDQQLRFMENAEQSMNDIKEILNNMADMTSQMVPKEKNRNYGSNKIDFISGGFDIKEYGRHMLENSLIGTAAQLVLPVAAPYLALMGFDVSGIESFGMGGGLKINPLSMLLKKTRTFKNLSKFSNNMENYAKMFFSNITSRNDGLGVVATLLGLGTEDVTAFRSRPSMSRYDKGIARWDGKDQRALREVIPGYLSKIEANTSILAQQVAKLSGNDYINEVAKNTRLFDEEDGYFKSFDTMAKDIQESLNSAAMSAASEFTDTISKVINGAESTKTQIAGVLEDFFNRSGFTSKDDIVNLGTIIKKNLAEVRDDDMSKDAKLIREIRDNPASFANFLRTAIDSLDQGKIGYISSRDRILGDVASRDNSAYKIMNDRSNLTKTIDKNGKYVSKYNKDYIVSARELQDIFARDRLANASEEERAAIEAQQRQTEGLDNVRNWFNNTWLGKTIKSIKVKSSNHPITRDIRNRGVDLVLNPASTKISSLLHDGVDFYQFGDIQPETPTNGVRTRVRRRGADAIANAQNAVENNPLHPVRTKVRRRRNRNSDIGNVRDFQNNAVESATTPEELQAAQTAEMADNIRDIASASAEQNTRLFGKNGLISQFINNSQIGKLFAKLKEKLFGDKGEDGFYSNGPLSDIANFGVDNKLGIRRIFYGKGYTDSEGNVYEDTDDAVFKRISKGANSIRTNILKRYLGENYRESEMYQGLPNFLKDKEDRKYHNQPPTDGRKKVKVRRITNQVGSTEADNVVEETSTDLNPQMESNTDSQDLKPQKEANNDGQVNDNDPSVIDRSNNSKNIRVNKENMQSLRDQFNDPDKTSGYIQTGNEWYEVNRETFDKLMNEYVEKYGELEPTAVQKQLSNSVKSISDKVKGAAPIAITGAIVGGLGGAAAAGGIIPAILGVGGPIGGIIAGTGIALATRSNTFMEKVFGKDDGDGKKVGGIISDQFQKSLKKKMPYVVAGGALGALKGILLPSAATAGMGAIPAALFGGVLGPAILGIGTGLLLSSDKIKESLFGKDNGDGTRTEGPLSKFTNKANDVIRNKILKQLGAGAAGAGVGALLGSLGVGLPGAIGPLWMGIAGAGIGIASVAPKFNEAIFGTKNLDKDGNVIGRNKDGLLDRLGNYLKINFVNPVAVWAKHMFGEIGSYLRDDIKDNLSIIFNALKAPFEDVATKVKDLIAKLGSGITKAVKAIVAPIGNLTGSLIKGLLKGGMTGLELTTKFAGGLISAPLKAMALVSAIGKGDLINSTIDQWKYYRAGVKDKLKNRDPKKETFFEVLNSSTSKEARLKSNADWAQRNGNDVNKSIAQKAIDKYSSHLRRGEDKDQKTLSGNITKWAKHDNYDETVSISNKGKYNLDKRKKAIAKYTKFDTSEWTQEDVKNFMYSSQVRSGKYDEFKTIAQQAQENATKAKEREAKEDQTRDNIVSITDNVGALREDLKEGFEAVVLTLNDRDIQSGNYAGLDDIRSDDDLNDRTRIGKLEDQENKEKEEKKAKKDAEKKERDAQEAKEGQEARGLGESMGVVANRDSESSDSDEDDDESESDKKKGPLSGLGELLSDKLGTVGKLVGAISVPILAIAAIKNPEKIAEFIGKIPAFFDSVTSTIGTAATKVGDFLKGYGKYFVDNSSTFLLPGDGQLFTGDNLFDSLDATLFGGEDHTKSRSKTGVDKYGNEYGIKNGHLTGSIKNLNSRLIRRGMGWDLHHIVKNDIPYALKKGRAGASNWLYTKIFGSASSEVDDALKAVASGSDNIFRLGNIGTVATESSDDMARLIAESSDNAFKIGATSMDDIMKAGATGGAKIKPVKIATNTADDVIKAATSGGVKVKPVKVASKAANETAQSIMTTAGKSGISAWDDIMVSATKNVATEAVEEISEGAAKSAVSNGAKAAASAVDDIATSNFKRIWQTLTDGVKAAMEKHSKKGVTSAATAAVTKEMGEVTAKGSSKLKDLIKKYAAKINKSYADAAAEAAAKTTTPIGWVITGVCAVWDVTTGALDAANLFYVREEDVDAKMRLISSILKMLIGLSLIASIIDVVNEIFAELIGMDLKTWLATLIYKCLSSNQDAIKLDKAQLKFRTDLDEYNKEHGTNLTLKTYNEKENAKVGTKVWDGIKSAFDPQGIKSLFTSHKNTNRVESRSGDDELFSSIENQAATSSSNLGFGNLVDNAKSSGDQYSQEDSRWKNVQFGKTRSGRTTTIGTGGCGPTALANVYKNITGRKDVTPTTIANMAIDSGYTSDGGSNAGLFTEGATRLGLSSQRIDPREIPSRLMAGQSVIMSGKRSGSGSPYTDSGHIISASGMKNGQIIVNDPLKSNSSRMSVNSVMSGINKAWAIDGSRGYGDNKQFSQDTLGFGPLMYNSAEGKFFQTNTGQLARDHKNLFGDTIFADGDQLGVFYSQLDSEWGSTTNNTGSVAGGGCFLSSLGMAMSALTGGIDFDPGSLAKMFPGNSSGVTPDEFKTMAAMILASPGRYPGTVDEPKFLPDPNSDEYVTELDNVRERMVALLKKGYPVIVQGNMAPLKYGPEEDESIPTVYDDEDFWTDFRYGRNIFKSFIDGNSEGRANSNHFTMLLGYHEDGGHPKTYLFNPGRSNISNGVRIVDIDGAIDNYKTRDPKFGSLKSLRYFTRDKSLTLEDSAIISKNIQNYCGVLSDGTPKPSMSELQEDIQEYFKAHSLADPSNSYTVTTNANNIITAALTEEEIGAVKSGSLSADDFDKVVNSSISADGSINQSYYNDGSEPESKFEKVAKILGKFSQIGINMLSAVLSGDPKSYKSIYDNQWTYQNSPEYLNQQSVTEDSSKYIFFGNDINGNPILLPSTASRSSILNDAQARLKADYLARYEAGIQNPQNAYDAMVLANFNKKGNFYDDAVENAEKKAEKNAKKMLDDAIKNNDYYTYNDIAVAAGVAPIKDNEEEVYQTATVKSALAKSSTAFPEWALDNAGYVNTQSYYKSSRMSQELQNALALRIGELIPLHESITPDTMNDENAKYFTPYNLKNENRTTFGLGFFGATGSEALVRLAKSGEVSKKVADEAIKWAKRMNSSNITGSDLVEFTNFLRREDVRGPLKTIQDAMTSQLSMKYVERAGKYYDQGIINDPRSIILAGDMYHASNKADFIGAYVNGDKDLSKVGTSGELAAVRHNMLNHISHWGNYDLYKNGWANRINDTYSLMTTGNSTKYPGFSMPLPDAVRNAIPAEAEGYGDLDLKNNFKSYSTYKSSTYNRPLRLTEMGSGGGRKTSSVKPLSITANRTYTPSALRRAEGYGQGVDMGPMETKTDRVISLLERVASNTGRKQSEERTTINNYNTTNNNSSIGYGDLNMSSDGKGNTIIVTGKNKSATDNLHTDKLRQLHEKIARSPRH